VNIIDFIIILRLIFFFRFINDAQIVVVINRYRLLCISNDRPVYTDRAAAVGAHRVALGIRIGLGHCVQPADMPVQMGQWSEDGRVHQFKPHQHTQEPEQRGAGARPDQQQNTGDE